MWIQSRDPECIRTPVTASGSGPDLPWWRSVLSECSCLLHFASTSCVGRSCGPCHVRSWSHVICLLILSCHCVLTDSDPRPPPVIYHGPQNQTLPTDGSAVLPCLASGQPAPNIIWLKGRSPLSTRDRRINVVESGSLEISGTTLQYYVPLVFITIS